MFRRHGRYYMAFTYGCPCCKCTLYRWDILNERERKGTCKCGQPVTFARFTEMACGAWGEIWSCDAHANVKSWVDDGSGWKPAGKGNR